MKARFLPLQINQRSMYFFGLKELLDIPMVNLQRETVQETFLHERALIARHELLDLLCKHLLLPKTQVTYTTMNALGWHFAQKLIRQDGKTFWATDTRFPYGGLRRDVLRIAGSESTGTGRNKRYTALCCQAILFVTVTNLGTLIRHTAEITSTTMTFVLGRWFRPHQSVRLRDNDNRPICSGPLNTNHCLWKYAQTARSRKALVGANGRPSAAYERQKRLFGANRNEQMLRYERDKNAYYCLLETNSILDKVNICPEFIADTSEIDYTTWLQTVTLI